MILGALKFMEKFEKTFHKTVKNIFLYNIIAMHKNILPKNTLHQLRTWQYDLADILEFYYTE